LKEGARGQTSDPDLRPSPSGCAARQPSP
jgi:hypothetical protein